MKRVQKDHRYMLRTLQDFVLRPAVPFQFRHHAPLSPSISLRFPLARAEFPERFSTYGQLIQFKYFILVKMCFLIEFEKK